MPPAVIAVNRRRGPASPITLDFETRARISDEIRAHLDRATMLLDFLNAVDAPLMDLEPDTEGEAEPDEATAQPITLAPDRSPVQVVRPSRRQMRAAYRAAGEPVPVNLRGVLGRLWS